MIHRHKSHVSRDPGASNVRTFIDNKVDPSDMPILLEFAAGEKVMLTSKTKRSGMLKLPLFSVGWRCLGLSQR